MRVAIVGLGLMGGSLGLALRRAGISVVGLDSDAATTARALELGAIEAPADRLDAADLVVLAVPLGAVRSTLAQVPRGVLTTDLCSTKVAVVEWAREAGLNFVGGHPLCGSERSGIDAARADLYAGAPWALTRPDPVVEEMVTAAGAEPLIVSPEEHDRLVAAGSHLAFLVSAAYMLAAAEAADWPAIAALTGSGFRDMTRLAAGDPQMYTAILTTNRENILARLDEFQVALERFRLRLMEEDPELADLFERGRAARLAWAESRRT